MRLKQTILAALFASVLVLPAFAQTPPVTAPVTAPMATPAKPVIAAPATAVPAMPVKPVVAAPAATAPAVTPIVKPTAAAKPPIGPVNVNTATPAELDALPGIGKARTKAIIAGRPYKSVDEIDTKKIIPHATFEKIKAQLTL